MLAPDGEGEQPAAPAQVAADATTTQGNNADAYVDLVVDAYYGALPGRTFSTFAQTRAPLLSLMHQRYAMLNAAMAYARLGDQSKAEKALRQAIQAAPDSAAGPST